MYLLQLWRSFGLSTLSSFGKECFCWYRLCLWRAECNSLLHMSERKLLACWVSVSLTSPALSNSILDSYLTHHHRCPTSPADFDMVVRLHLSHSGTGIWDHIVVLVCVSVLVNHVKQQPMWLFAFCECLWCPLPIWKMGLWLCFLMLCGRFWIEVLC